MSAYAGKITIGLFGDDSGLSRVLANAELDLKSFAQTAKSAGADAAAAVAAPAARPSSPASSAATTAAGPAPAAASAGSGIQAAASVASAAGIAGLVAQAAYVGQAMRKGLQAVVPIIDRIANAMAETARVARRENMKIFDEKLQARIDSVNNKYAKGFLVALQGARKVEDEIEHWSHAADRVNGVLGRFTKFKLPTPPAVRGNSPKDVAGPAPGDGPGGGAVAAAGMGLGGPAGLALAALAGVGAMGAAASAGIYKAVKAGSELSEQLNRAGVVFGDQLPTISGAADEMARKFGVVKSEFLEGASGLGAMAQAAGLTDQATADLSGSMAKLAADLSSQDNLEFSESLSKIRSALAGEAEPLRRHGVLLTEEAVKAKVAAMGLVKFGEQVTDSAKMQARAAIIAEGLGRASGDLENTAGGVANGMRGISGRIENMFADVGMAIQPVAEAFLVLGNAVLRELAGWVDRNKQALADWATTAGSSSGFVVRAFKFVGQAIGVVADALHFAPIAFLALQSVATGAAAGVVRAMASVGSSIEQVLNMIPGVHVEFTAALGSIADDLEDLSGKQWQKMLDELGKPLPSDGITRWFDDIARAATDAIAKAKELGQVQREADAAATAASNDAARKADADYAKHLGEQAKGVLESTRSPLEKLAAEYAKLDNLQAEGLLTAAQVAKAKDSSARQTLGGIKNPAALEANSREARSAILASREQARDPIKQVPDLLKQQVKVTGDTNGLLRRIADRVEESSMIGVDTNLNP